jgi:solute carrier family 35 (UDP-galactose transporter), member B1
MAISSELQLLISVSGIYFFYLYYGILQEQIWTTTEDDGNRFTFMLFLLLVQCVTNAFVAYIGASLFDSSANKNKKDKSASVSMSKAAKTAPNYLKMIMPNVSGNTWMAVISLTYLSAMGASNQSLNYVNYPTQALGKSCKMIPIMLLNVLIGGKKYSLREYLCVLSITLGIVFFRLAKSKSGNGQENSSFGLVLLFASLSLDGLTASNQRLFRTEFKPSTVSIVCRNI